MILFAKSFAKLYQKRSFAQNTYAKTQKKQAPMHIFLHKCLFLVEAVRSVATEQRACRASGTCAFSGAPRQTITNRLFCQRGVRFPSAVRQNILLPQNGSPPLKSRRNAETIKNTAHQWCTVFLVEQFVLILNLKYRNLYKGVPYIRLLSKTEQPYQYHLPSKALDFPHCIHHSLREKV